MAILAACAALAGCGSGRDLADLQECADTAQRAVDIGHTATETAQQALDIAEQWKAAALRYERLLDRHEVKYKKVVIE